MFFFLNKDICKEFIKQMYQCQLVLKIICMSHFEYFFEANIFYE